jgi:hypothetical protein
MRAFERVPQMVTYDRHLESAADDSPEVRCRETGGQGLFYVTEGSTV